ncbi:hypothetical protein Sjap_018643 [Stephania japonica]|uniref:Programmed cell death protein 2 C-terminal domain-containing protein n=1 Tax=Stephania japonica TaxID=461633 RepID=A0AAP0I8L0_9MAGN
MIEKVVLGMPGSWAKNHREKSDHYTTKIGGIPVFAPILNGDLRVEERVVYVFGCVMPSCGGDRNSWRVIRIQKSSFGGEKSSSAGEGVNYAECVDECVDEKREFGSDDDIDLEALSKALSKAMTLASKSKKLNSLQKSKGVVRDSPGKPSKELIDTLTPGDNQTGINDHQEEETWEEERYEYDKALCADRTYLKFKKRLDAHPEQCFRYLFGGKPLLAMKELEEPGRCQSCGAPRKYEMQLMPPLLYFLHEADDDGTSTHTVQHWDWMTLIAYTCSKSCFDAANRSGSWSILEEAVIVQVEKPIEGLATLGHF